MKALIYDCEIKKGILKKNEAPIPGIEYCDGWDDQENMGISLITAYQMDLDLPRVFMDDNILQFQELVDEYDMVVGFNNWKFDDSLCAINGINIPEDKSYDLLAEIWITFGLDPRKFSFKTHTKRGLDAVAVANGIIGKSGSGEMAPVLYQRGEYGALVNYGLRDTIMLHQLIMKAWFGPLIDPKEGGRMFVRSPIESQGI